MHVVELIKLDAGDRPAVLVSAVIVIGTVERGRDTVVGVAWRARRLPPISQCRGRTVLAPGGPLRLVDPCAWWTLAPGGRSRFSGGDASVRRGD